MSNKPELTNKKLLLVAAKTSIIYGCWARLVSFRLIKGPLTIFSAAGRGGRPIKSCPVGEFTDYIRNTDHIKLNHRPR